MLDWSREATFRELIGQRSSRCAIVSAAEGQPPSLGALRRLARMPRKRLNNNPASGNLTRLHAANEKWGRKGARSLRLVADL
eukprot:14425690-Alexandrium_andersonii.AAC.1